MNKALKKKMVERKLAEMMGDSHDGIFEPFFQPQAIAAAIRKLETVPQRRKWQYYCAEWGCLICQSKERRHTSGSACAKRATGEHTQGLLMFCVVRRTRGRSRHRFAICRIWLEALRAASSSDDEDSPLGAAGIPALEVETRPYLATAQREKVKKTTLDRITAWRNKRARRAETLHQAKALHGEQGLTWREVARFSIWTSTRTRRPRRKDYED